MPRTKPAVQQRVPDLHPPYAVPATKEIFLLPNVSKGDLIDVAFVVFRDAFDTRNTLLFYLVRLVQFGV